ncbi:MAG: DUF1045 domain-containing protein [Alphaproteobacteria bacterium]|nr:DUF1045 domain-containing protein [Alphaproteobacteria bacterium]
MRPRHAIYWSPPAGSGLARFAAAWLGRDPGGGIVGARPAVPGFAAAAVDEMVAEPARYGFHGTLKPPFHLAAGTDRARLDAAFDAFAAARPPFTAPKLALRAIGGFLALVPDAPAPALDALAADCVAFFDRFRAPSEPGELERRRRADLSPRQQELLARWGYPYVMDEFRFHLTLTGRLAPEVRPRLLAALAPLAAPFCTQPLAVDQIALFVQPGPDAPFTIVRRAALRGADSDNRRHQA